MKGNAAMEPLLVDIPPTILRIPWEDKTYVVSGSTWVQVPSGTTLEEASKYMVFRGWQTGDSANPSSWPVKGSTGKEYTVNLLKEGFYTCSCPGYSFRRKCKHIEQIKKSLRIAS